jgi:hypothetical protein
MVYQNNHYIRRSDNRVYRKVDSPVGGDVFIKQEQKNKNLVK